MILFDIDGTLIERSEAHRLAWRHGFSRVYGIEPQDDDKYGGQTDLFIMTEKCRDAGLGERQINEGLEKMKSEMCRIINRLVIRYPVQPYPGVPEALRYLKDNGHRLGLLTGNLRCIAKAKLMSIGLWEYFSTGGFGDNAMDKTVLAKKLAQEKTIGVGDAPADIKAYKEAGIIAIGVASGMSKLAGADMVIDAITPETVRTVLKKFYL